MRALYPFQRFCINVIFGMRSVRKIKRCVAAPPRETRLRGNSGMIFLFMLGFILSASSCEKDVKWEEEATIRYLETVEFESEQLLVTFEEINDSRCPLNVTCVRAGEARVLLVVRRPGAEDALELEVQGLCQDEPGPCGQIKDLLGYRFELLFVYPYPSEGVEIRREDYSIKLVVSAL